MTQTRIRTALMDSSIKVEAREGLDKFTTRSIASECDLHDAYIYRYFIDKDDLLKKAFLREDRVLTEKIMSNAGVFEMEGLSFRERLRAMWMPAWEHLMENPDVCKFYVRYYYSVHYENDAIEEFKANNLELKRKFASLLPDGTDVEMIFQYNVDTLLHLAMKVTSGEIENTEDMPERVFHLLYSVNMAFVQQQAS